MALPGVLTPLLHTPGPCPTGSFVSGNYELNQKFDSGHGVGDAQGWRYFGGQCPLVVSLSGIRSQPRVKQQAGLTLTHVLLPRPNRRPSLQERGPPFLTPGRQECGHTRHQGGIVGAPGLPGARTRPPARCSGPGICWRPNGPARRKSRHQTAKNFSENKTRLPQRGTVWPMTMTEQR